MNIVNSNKQTSTQSCQAFSKIDVVDRCLSIVALIALSPIIILRACIALLAHRRVFEKQAIAVPNNKSFYLLSFAGNFPGRQLARIINLVNGQLAWLGPKSGHKITTNKKPGLFSPAELRKTTGIIDPYHANENEEQLYIPETVSKYLALLLRCTLMSLLSTKVLKAAGKQVNLFDVPVDNMGLSDALEWITDRAKQNRKTVINFANAHCFNVACHDMDYRKILRESTRVLPDGSGIRLACRFQGLKLKANLNGTDLFPHLCRVSGDEGLPLFLLGAKPGVAEDVAIKMTERYPDLIIAGTHHGYINDENEDQVINIINKSGACILLVAMGVPMQEKWIARNQHKLQTSVNMAVGGLFDFYAERVSRAPVWLREMGLEWTWRLLQEPSRMWKRYIMGNPAFVIRAWLDSRHQLARQQHPNYLNNSNPIVQRVTASIRRLYWLFSPEINQAGKRMMDVTISASMLMLLSPLILLTALFIRIESPGPVFFKQSRIGLRGKTFDFWKFRSMYLDAEQRKHDLLSKNEMHGGVLFKLKDDPRITKVGIIIRRYSIDELPQLWNVLRGDMSLVGPRPALASEVNQYSLYDRYRLSATPGITCHWQVSGRSDIPFDQQVQMDLDYIHTSSLYQDIQLLIKTVPAVLSGRGAY